MKIAIIILSIFTLLGAVLFNIFKNKGIEMIIPTKIGAFIQGFGTFALIILLFIIIS